MIYGIGTDICDVRRIARDAASAAASASPQKVLGPARDRGVPRSAARKVEARGVRYLATRFSAKEAFSKAIGLGMRMPMTWRACEIVKAPSGKPEIRLHGALADWFDARGLRAHVSVTDETDYAATFVVVETRKTAHERTRPRRPRHRRHRR